MSSLSPHPELAEAEGPPLVGQPQTLRDILANTAIQNPTSNAVISCYQNSQLLPVPNTPPQDDPAKTVWTYKQLVEAADRLAASFYSRGIRKNMHVVVFLYNSAEWALLFWTCAKLGATFVPLDARGVLRKEAVLYFLKVKEPAVLVVSDSPAAVALQQSHEALLRDIPLKLTVESDDAFPSEWACLADVMSCFEASTADSSDCDGIEINAQQDIALMVFTSGTSGLPKACPHSGKTLWAACMTANVIRPRGPMDSVVQHLPWSHIFACWDMLSFWSAGAKSYFHQRSSNPRRPLMQ